MPNVYQKHAASLKAVQQYLGPACPSVTWNGKAIPVLPGSAIKRKDLGQGGFKAFSDFTFTVLVSDDPGMLLKQLVTYLGDNYRIDSSRTLAGATIRRFECNDPNQPA